MALGALDLLHKIVLGMKARLINSVGLRVAFVLLPVTLGAVLPGYDDSAMSVRNLVRSVHNIVEHEHVGLWDRKMMALMAVDFFMNTGVHSDDCYVVCERCHAEGPSANNTSLAVARWNKRKRLTWVTK